MLQRRRLEEGCWLAPEAPRKEPESGWTLAAREEGLENAEEDTVRGLWS